MLADRAYDSGTLRARIAQADAEAVTEAVIPPSPSCPLKLSYDRELYREWNRVKRLIGALKHYRRVATRYDQTARKYLSFVQIASVLPMVD